GQLVSIYYFGKGVPQNYVEMLKWLILGDLQKEDKDKTPSSLRNQYTSKMTPEQIAEAQRLANQWKPTPERVDLDLSSTLSTKTKPSWWQFWNRSPYLPH